MDEVTYYLEKLKKTLIFIKYYKNKSEMIFRCPFCGDSQKSPHKGHLYLNLEYLYFNCFKCDVSGTINTLIKMFIGGKTIPLDKIKPKQNKIYYRTDFIKSLETNNNVNNLLFNIPLTLDNIGNYKNKYLHFLNRVIKFDNNKIDKLNMLNDLITKQKNISIYPEIFLYNNLDSFKNYNIDFSKIINKNSCVMFIGFQKLFYSFRDVINKETLFGCKYVNIRKDETTEDFFIIINQVKHKNLYSLFSKDFLTIAFAEGAFDIINLYLYQDDYKSKLVNKEKPDIFIAAYSKKSYIRAIKFIFNTFMIPFRALIFLDPDSANRKFCQEIIYKTKILYKKNINNSFKYFLKSIDFFKNKNSSDYGDINKNIIDIITV